MKNKTLILALIIQSGFISLTASASNSDLQLSDKIQIIRGGAIDFPRGTSEITAGTSVAGNYVNCSFDGGDGDSRWARSVVGTELVGSVTRVNERRILNKKAIEIGQAPVYVYVFELSTKTDVKYTHGLGEGELFTNKNVLKIRCESTAAQNNWLDIVQIVLTQISISK